MAEQGKVEAIEKTARAAGSSVNHRQSRRRPFLPAVLIGAVMAIVGFWRTYFAPLLAGAVDEPTIIHVHAVLMVTWLALVIAQVWLAASGRMRLHIRLGPGSWATPW